jgi:hypothetical protein
MFNKSDQDLIRSTSKQIIEGTGESIIRRRVKTDIPPHDYDSDFGETHGAPQYLEISFTGKVFFSITEKQLIEIFGEVKSADALAHVPFDTDVITGDILLIRGIEYRVREIKEAPLKGFNAARIEKIT